MEQGRLQIFAERFRTLRGEMTQGEFAEFLGISRPTVGFYENGTRIPDALVLRQIAENCHVSTDWLVGLSEVKALNGELRQVCDYTGLSEDSVRCLNMLSQLNESPKVALELMEAILLAPILNFRDYAWRGALASIQCDRAMKPTTNLPWKEYSKTDAYQQEQKRLRESRKSLDRKLAEEASKPQGEASFTVEISAADAARLYRDRAVSCIKSSAEQVLLRYKKELIELIDAEDNPTE